MGREKNHFPEWDAIAGGGGENAGVSILISFVSFRRRETRAAISHFPRAYFTVERAARQ